MSNKTYTYSFSKKEKEKSVLKDQKKKKTVPCLIYTNMKYIIIIYTTLQYLNVLILFADGYHSLGHPRCNKFLLQISYSVRAIVDDINMSCLSIRKSIVICPFL